MNIHKYEGFPFSSPEWVDLVELELTEETKRTLEEMAKRSRSEFERCAEFYAGEEETNG